MISKEVDDLIDTLFPIGQERWVKVKYLNKDKVLKAFRLFQKSNPDDERGYEVTAIGIRDDYAPQVSALMDIKDKISMMYGLPEESFTYIRSIIDLKIAELKQLTIVTEMPQ